jgi:hypothetical protein
MTSRATAKLHQKIAPCEEKEAPPVLVAPRDESPPPSSAMLPLDGGILQGRLGSKTKGKEESTTLGFR